MNYGRCNMRLIVTVFKALRKLKEILFNGIYSPIAKLMLALNGVRYGKDLQVNGLIDVMVTRRGVVSIGDNLCMNSGEHFNVIGRQQKCIFWVEGTLTIHNNVGMSAVAIICHTKISIGNNVLIGGNTVIYDTDFHSLNPRTRLDKVLDRTCTKKSPVVIEDNVFIGAHSTILKGVTIGSNSIVGACSVVSKSIPPNEIWAGNPAKFIRAIDSVTKHA